MTLQVWNRLENPLVLALCCLLLLPFIFPCPLILYNQQQCIPLYRKKKTKTSQSLFVCCLELYSHSSLVEAQTALCPAGFKEAEMAADVGTLQSHVCPRPCIVVPLTFHVGTLSLTHVMTSDRF